MSARDISIRATAGLCCAFLLFTLIWVVWAFLTPGDYFANGSGLLMPTLLLGVVGGLIWGVRASGRWRMVLLAAAVVSLCYWIFVPDGWWASEPPGHDQAEPVARDNAGKRVEFRFAVHVIGPACLS